MLKHIVMWRLKEEALGATKEENSKKLIKDLKDLQQKIPEVLHIEAGIDVNGSEAAADVVLYSEFESMEDLQTYQKHPDHVEVVNFVKEIVTERRVVDYFD